MKTKSLWTLLCALTMLAAATPHALAAHGAPCPEYDVELEVGSYAYARDDEGRWKLSSTTMHVTRDELSSNGYLFSIWIYAESNGVPGLQRYDDYCEDVATAHEADTVLF